MRRIKKEIYPSDIGINQQHTRPVLISEQLTRANQELLYQARSIRGSNGFKFVWSHNGQILARRKEGDRVIRIIDLIHLNQLKTELQTKLTNNERQRTATEPIIVATSESQT